MTTISPARGGAVADARDALQAGQPVVLSENGPTGGGSVVLPAALADPHWTAWTIRWTSGFLCAPLPTELADALHLPLMTAHNREHRPTAYTVAVDAAGGVTTGISAADRATTARVLADPRSTPTDLIRPGHLVPIRVHKANTARYFDRATSSVALCELAGLPPVAMVGSIMNDDGGTAAAETLPDFAARHGHPLVGLTDVASYLLFCGIGGRARVTRTTFTPLPTEHGEFDAFGFHDELTGAEHTVLRAPGTSAMPLVSVHVECPLGDVFGAISCSCGRDLTEATSSIARDGGLLVYLRRPFRRALGPSESAEILSAATSDDGAVAAMLTNLGTNAIRLRTGPVTPYGLTLGGIRAVHEPSPYRIQHRARESR